MTWSCRCYAGGAGKLMFPGRTNYVPSYVQPALEIFCSQRLLRKRLVHPSPQCPGNLVLHAYLPYRGYFAGGQIIARVSPRTRREFRKWAA